MAMRCDIREPYILKAMGEACSQARALKGHLREGDRHEIADRILEIAGTGETSIDKLVSFAIADFGEGSLFGPPLRLS